MVPLFSLWLPILLSAVFVFVASSVIHMVLGYHQNDYAKVPNEEGVADALRQFNIPPGEYMMPKPATAKEMNTPDFQQRLTRGPVLALTVWPNGPFAMGAQLVQWFVYCLVIGVYTAYLASRTVAPGVEYLQVFRVAGAVAFAAYGLAHLQASIWYRRAWSTTLKSLADSLVYGLLTAGTFGWLWPS
jgi:hypothetical protein